MNMINPTLIKKLEPEYEEDRFGTKCSFNSKERLHSFYDYPAIIWEDGSQYWYRNGLLHRDNDLPAVIWNDGRKEWWVDGALIREDSV